MTDVKSKTLRSLLTGCLVLVGTAGATSSLVVGCSGDDNGTPPAGDAGGDGASEGSTPDASHQDGTVPDASGDSALNDAGLDSGDASNDAADAQDAAETSVLQASQYAAAVAEGLCARIQYCCDIDAGSFDTSGCIATFGGNPLLVGEATPYLDSGLIDFNPAQAGACLTDIANFPCGTVSAMQNIQLGQACVGAFSGVQNTGGPCAAPIECPSTDYCLLPTDGGTGTCTPLEGDGGSCTDQTQCSYLGNGIPAQYCNSIDHICLPELPVGAQCSNYAQCQTQVCLPPMPYTCQATAVFTQENVPGTSCELFTLDAGGD
jgi:hypothetical protein